MSRESDTLRKSGRHVFCRESVTLSKLGRHVYCRESVSLRKRDRHVYCRERERERERESLLINVADMSTVKRECHFKEAWQTCLLSRERESL